LCCVKGLLTLNLRFVQLATAVCTHNVMNTCYAGLFQPMFWSNGFAQPVGLMRFKKCKPTIGFVYIWPKYELKQSETTQANIYKVPSTRTALIVWYQLNLYLA